MANKYNEMATVSCELLKFNVRREKYEGYKV